MECRPHLTNMNPTHPPTSRAQADADSRLGSACHRRLGVGPLDLASRVSLWLGQLRNLLPAAVSSPAARHLSQSCLSPARLFPSRFPLRTETVFSRSSSGRPPVAHIHHPAISSPPNRKVSFM
ncbi:unnamed protein product [Arctogadus glacialis]